MNDKLDQQFSEKDKKKKEKYLVFSLEKQNYAFSLSSVKEVIGLTDITPIANTPKYFKGLINLRGTIISVIDLKLKINVQKREEVNKEASQSSQKKCIIIVDIEKNNLGFIVDNIDKVIEFRQEQIELGLENNEKENGHGFLQGMAKMDDNGLIIILDTKKIIHVEEMNILKFESNTMKMAG